MAQQKTKYVINPITGALDLITNVASLVDGPSSSSDNAIAIYDGITGKLIKNSLAFVQSDGRVTASADATNSLDLVTKQQLDAAIQGVDVKEGVRAGSVANLTLSGEQTIDGVALVTGNRILVKNQTSLPENGIYTVSSGAWSRTSDANTASELNGAFVAIAEGSTLANTGWYQSNEIVTLGTDNVQFNQFFGAGTYVADGLGIELIGSTFSLELDGGTLSKAASGLKVADQGITNTQISNSAGIAYSKLNLGNSIVDADINSSAAISLSKLQALTGDRALISTAGGAISASSVTNVELGYLSGVTSAIQTQLDNKLEYSLNTQTTNFTAINKGQYLIDSSGGAIIVTMPIATVNGYVILKDIGNASTNNITINGSGGALIDGSASLVVTSDYENVLLVSNGTNWFRL